MNVVNVVNVGRKLINAGCSTVGNLHTSSFYISNWWVCNIGHIDPIPHIDHIFYCGFGSVAKMVLTCNL